MTDYNTLETFLDNLVERAFAESGNDPAAAMRWLEQNTQTGKPASASDRIEDFLRRAAGDRYREPVQPGSIALPDGTVIRAEDRMRYLQRMEELGLNENELKNDFDPAVQAARAMSSEERQAYLKAAWDSGDGQTTLAEARDRERIQAMGADVAVQYERPEAYPEMVRRGASADELAAAFRGEK